MYVCICIAQCVRDVEIGVEHSSFSFGTFFDFWVEKRLTTDTLNPKVSK
jgi:hypothetical protein